eukprot:gb/GECG01011425.1/.p1 GENE.gb/GECG01011425.1/~~gb/GECG01011425.1/.p1  ORF type:complete len:533 (+),score=58.47 gb/GECG01011425.1/:1-1599(+)
MVKEKKSSCFCSYGKENEETRGGFNALCRAKPGRRKIQARLMVFEPLFLYLITLTALLTFPGKSLAQESGSLRDSILDGHETCFQYFPDDNLFRMNCTVLNWKDHNYNGDTHVLLKANEVFDGGGRDGNIIDLGDTQGFRGLITVENNGDDIESLDEAPVIRNVHVKNGKSVERGGFIVRKVQKYIAVYSCSSTGEVDFEAGGIFGVNAGRNGGHVKISNSHSTGTIRGNWAGGIAGRNAGYNNGTVSITACYSSGKIEGKDAGGICGDNTGHTNGHVYITRSYSTGSIHGDWSGGITGKDTTHNDGEVHIRNCYTRGSIEGDRAGGITGGRTGGCCGLETGNVYITNTYASGVIQHPNGGGIIGGINGDLSGVIQVQYSVYNGSNGATTMVGDDNVPEDVLTATGISNTLDDIRGQVYHYEGAQKWDNETWALKGTDALPILRFQLMQSSANSTDASPTARAPMSPSKLIPSSSPAAPSISATPWSSANSSSMPDTSTLGSSARVKRLAGLDQGKQRIPVPLRRIPCKKRD